MSRTLKQFLVVMGLMSITLTIFNFAPAAFAQGTSGGVSVGGSVLNDSDKPDVVNQISGGSGDIRSLALRIINFFLLFLGLVAVVMIIYAGVLYVTSAGGDQIETAKKIIMYAVIGILLIAISFALVNTILKAGTGETA
ncbi:MAG: pilin [Patescibacteria group bacterium]